MKTIHKHVSKNGIKYRLVENKSYDYKIQYYNTDTKCWKIYDNLTFLPFDTAKSIYSEIYMNGHYWSKNWGKVDHEYIQKVKQVELGLFGSNG